MKVLMIRNPAAKAGCKLQEGETGDVPDALGKSLVANGLAQCLDPPKAIAAIPDRPVEAVPPETAIEDSPPPSPLTTSEPKAAKPSQTTKPKKRGPK